MTEPTPTRPVPGPPRSVPAPAEAPTGESAQESAARPAGRGEERFADLDELPVGEHVAVFEAEHSRLQRELGTIDQL